MDKANEVQTAVESDDFSANLQSEVNKNTGLTVTIDKFEVTSSNYQLRDLDQISLNSYSDYEISKK